MNIKVFTKKMNEYNKKIKEFIVKVFHIRTYEKEVDRITQINKELVELYESIVTSYKRELENANDKIYKLETLNKEPLLELENINRVKNSSYAQGRKDAYAEMGIRALNARVDGNTILVDEEGKFIDVVTVPTLEEVCMSEGIDINDLEDVSPSLYVS